MELCSIKKLHDHLPVSPVRPTYSNTHIHLGSRSHYVTKIYIIGEDSRNEFG